jgi:hypothetical protein
LSQSTRIALLLCKRALDGGELAVVLVLLAIQIGTADAAESPQRPDTRSVNTRLHQIRQRSEFGGLVAEIAR